MSEIERLVKLFEVQMKGPSWHGPAVLEALEGVDYVTAAGKPIENAHSIHELVLHMATWKDVARWRIEGNEHVPTDDENFPPVKDTSPASWERAKRALKEAHEQLVKAVASMPEEKLEECFPEGPISHYIRLHGVIHHDLYHAGQIALLKRLQGK